MVVLLMRKYLIKNEKSCLCQPFLQRDRVLFWFVEFQIDIVIRVLRMLLHSLVELQGILIKTT